MGIIHEGYILFSCHYKQVGTQASGVLWFVLYILKHLQLPLNINFVFNNYLMNDYYVLDGSITGTQSGVGHAKAFRDIPTNLCNDIHK
jgi:hypothetical protein